MADKNLQNFLVKLSFDDNLLAEYSALKTNDEKRVYLTKTQGLSDEAAEAIINDEDSKIKELGGIIQNNQNNT